MTASDLLKNSQQYYVNSGTGVSRSITYRHTSGTLITDLNVFMNENEFNKIRQEKTQATARLTNVFLSESPAVNDVVVFDGESEKWRVQSWRKANGMYIIELTFNRYKL